MQRQPRQSPTPKTSNARDKIEVEPGFEKRLTNIYKKVLHTPPKHVPDKRTAEKKTHKSR